MAVLEYYASRSRTRCASSTCSRGLQQALASDLRNQLDGITIAVGNAKKLRQYQQSVRMPGVVARSNRTFSSCSLPDSLPPQCVTVRR